MTLLAIAVLGIGPGLAADPLVNWVTLPESNMQVELHLYKSGKFEAHEWWTGAQTKPMPNFAMKGHWTKQWDKVTLEIETTYIVRGETALSHKTKKLPIRSVHLLWTDVLKREHSLTQTSRRPATIDFGPAGRR